MSDQVIVLDTTLRVHQPSAGIDFSLDDKLEIATELARAGVDVIEVGQPAQSPPQYEAARRIAEEIRTARISMLACCTAQAIERVADVLGHAAEGRLHVFIAAKGADGPEVIAQAESMVRYARNLASDVEFSLMDATRSDPRFLAELVRRTLCAGATTINIPDIGFILPDELSSRIAQLYREVPELQDAVLSFHGHDDLGVATANAIAAVRAGARQVETAVNGLGGTERNTALEEIDSSKSVRASGLDRADGGAQRRKKTPRSWPRSDTVIAGQIETTISGKGSPDLWISHRKTRATSSRD